MDSQRLLGAYDAGFRLRTRERSVTILAPYREPTSKSDNEEKSVPEDPGVQLEGDEYIVERVIGNRIQDGIVMYHHKYLGYSESSWEPCCHVQSSLGISRLIWHLQKGLKVDIVGSSPSLF